MIGLSRGNRRALLKAMRKGFWMPQAMWPGRITHVLDVGAHVGMFAVYARMNWPNARILAVEPDELNYSRLMNNVENLDIHTLKAAFGRGWIGQANPGERDTSSLQYRPMELIDAHMRGINLHDMVAILQPDMDKFFLKMDIEGAEHALMDDPHLGVAVLRNAARVAMEIHPPRERIAEWFAATLQTTHAVTVVSRRRGGEPNVLHAVKKELEI